MLNKLDRVSINKPGYYKGETGYIEKVIPLLDGGFVYEVKINAECIYEPTETLLLYEDELTKL